MDIHLDRRRVLAGTAGVATSLLLPAWGAAAAAAPVSPERGLESYRRMLCGPEGEQVLWWYIGDVYCQTPGKSTIPVARVLSIGSAVARPATARSFSYRFHEAGAILDLATGEPLHRNPLTGEEVKPPLVDQPFEDIAWAMRDDGNIVRTVDAHSSVLNLHWTETSSNLLLLETEPGPNAFALAPGDGAADWTSPQSTRTVYARRADLARPGFVPAKMIYSVALKLTPPWLQTPDTADHWLIVRGIGQKSRMGEVVNQDALDLVNRLFPTFFK